MRSDFNKRKQRQAASQASRLTCRDADYCQLQAGCRDIRRTHRSCKTAIDMQHCADDTCEGERGRRTPPEFLLLPCTGALARAKMVCPSAPYPWPLAGASSPESPDDSPEGKSAGAFVALGSGATADGPFTLSLLALPPLFAPAHRT